MRTQTGRPARRPLHTPCVAAGRLIDERQESINDGYFNLQLYIPSANNQDIALAPATQYRKTFAGGKGEKVVKPI